jgi:hypothetical protein
MMAFALLIGVTNASFIRILDKGKLVAADDTVDYGSGSVIVPVMPQERGCLDDTKHLFIR